MSYIIKPGKRILRDITLKNFVMPGGYSIDGGRNGELIVIKNSQSPSECIKITFADYGVEICRGMAKTFYRCDQIKQIYYMQHIPRESDTYTCKIYSLRMEVFFGNGNYGEEVLFNDLDSPLFARFVEQEAEKTLGLEDSIVNREFDYKSKVFRAPQPAEGRLSYREEASSVCYEGCLPLWELVLLYLCLGISSYFIIQCFIIFGGCGVCAFGPLIALPAYFILSNTKNHIISLNGSRLEIFSKNIFFMRKKLLSCDMSEIASIHLFEGILVRSFEQRRHHFLRVEFSDPEKEPEDFFDKSDNFTIEFIDCRINGRIKSQF